MSTVGWIVLVVAVLIIAGVAVVVGRKRQLEAATRRDRETAAGLRAKGSETASDARQREADAMRQQAEAERLKQRAEQTLGEAETIRGRASDDLRTADEIDPDHEPGRHDRENDDSIADRDHRDDPR